MVSAEEALVVPERRITLTTEPKRGPLPRAAASIGQWPSFRGPQASGVADGQRLPDTWDGATGKNVLWRTVCQSGRGRRETDLPQTALIVAIVRDPRPALDPIFFLRRHRDRAGPNRRATRVLLSTPLRA
jgi:hypothetical protein